MQSRVDTTPTHHAWLLARRGLALAGMGALGAALTFRARPALALSTTREMTDMTWMEVRDAIQGGRRTVIVPSGGLEQNGPHMIIGKHDYIVTWAARRIAAELGDALVAPVISYVPEGEYDPPTGNMAWPGTMGVPPAIFAGVLEGIARSLRVAGFRTICFIADHGLSIAPQAEVAAKLTTEWGEAGPKVLAIDAYFAPDATARYLRGQGESDAAIGRHATIADTSELMAIHPDGVDLSRIPPDPAAFPRLGVFGDPRRSGTARGEGLMSLRVQAAVAQIRAATAG